MEHKLFTSGNAPTQLTTRKLDGHNYIQWARAVKMAITGYGKQRHLYETAPPSTDQSYEKWIQDDAQLISLLWNSMENNIANLCSHIETCKELWNHLHLLFGSNLTRMYDVSREFFQLQQGSQNMTEYFASILHLSEELNTPQPLTTDIHEMQRQREQMVVLKFLSGMKPEYDSVRAQILARQSLPSLAETYARVMRAIPTDVPSPATHS